MTQNICECHCGTRIDLDEQLLQQRQMWKQKYMCLQKQFKVDIETLKQNIYAECAGIMQQQFSSKQLQNNKIINQKNVQIKDLITRIINLETQVKVLTKQKELFQEKVKELESELSQKDQIINDIKSKSSRTVRDWELKHEQQIADIKQRSAFQSKQIIEKIQLENQALKQKLKQFEIKYQKLLPQIQKMKCALNSKTAQNQQLLATIQKNKKKQQQDLKNLNIKLEGINKIHGTCSKQIKQLSEENENLQRQLDRSKKTSKEVKVQPVYIDRPVEVEKVVQKIVQVQKLVNKYVDNPMNQKKMRQLDEQNQRLKHQLNNLLQQLKQIEQHYKKSVLQYEESIKQHEKNVVLYKKQRESLAFKIGEQNKELEMLHNFIQKISAQKSSRVQPDNEKIVVHVKQDGTYQKTVEKLPPAPAATSNQRKKK